MTWNLFRYIYLLRFHSSFLFTKLWAALKFFFRFERIASFDIQFWKSFLLSIKKGNQQEATNLIVSYCRCSSTQKFWHIRSMKLSKLSNKFPLTKPGEKFRDENKRRLECSISVKLIARSASVWSFLCLHKRVRGENFVLSLQHSRGKFSKRESMHLEHFSRTRLVKCIRIAYLFTIFSSNGTERTHPLQSHTSSQSINNRLKSRKFKCYAKFIRLHSRLHNFPIDF